MPKANPKRVGVEGGWLKIWQWMCHFSEEMERSILVNIIPSKEKNLRKSIDRFSTLHTFLQSKFLFMITVSITHWCSSVLLSLCTLWPDKFYHGEILCMCNHPDYLGVSLFCNYSNIFLWHASPTLFPSENEEISLYLLSPFILTFLPHNIHYVYCYVFFLSQNVMWMLFEVWVELSITKSHFDLY